MPSERDSLPAAPRRTLWAWLHSQELGILCGMSTVVLLAVGSVVLAVTRDGASAAIAMDDLRAFFQPPSIVHLWFYLLAAVLALYAANTLLATWSTVVWKWRRGARAPRFFAASIVHAAFLTGLLAHLVGGLAGAERGQRVVGPGWADLGDGRQARVTDLRVDRHPNGSTRQLAATLELRGAGGSAGRAVVGYNGPLSAGLGRDLFLLVRAGRVPAAKLVRAEAECVAGAEERCRFDDLEVAVAHVQETGGPHGPVARVLVTHPISQAREDHWLFQGRPQALGDGTVLTLAAVEPRPAILLRHRHAPGNPWALLASLLLVAGLLLMWRRFWPAPGAPEGEVA